MFHYQTTVLEDWIESLYKHLGISHPDEIDMDYIAEELNIWLYYMEMTSRAIEKNGMYSMIIDSRITRPEQWEDFGHEVCHPLRHAGNQFILPESMTQLQEYQAKNFAYHFCIPTFMLLKLSLPSDRNQAIGYVAKIFNVTTNFAEKRLILFERQMLSSELTNQMAATLEAQEKVTRSLGCDFTVRTGNSTMLYSFQRGVIGYLK